MSLGVGHQYNHLGFVEAHLHLLAIYSSIPRIFWLGRGGQWNCGSHLPICGSHEGLPSSLDLICRMPVCNNRFLHRLKRGVDMSEWLRRQTWNLLGYARAGSNPAVDVHFLFLIIQVFLKVVFILFLIIQVFLKVVFSFPLPLLEIWSHLYIYYLFY